MAETTFCESRWSIAHQHPVLLKCSYYLATEVVIFYNLQLFLWGFIKKYLTPVDNMEHMRKNYSGLLRDSRDQFFKKYISGNQKYCQSQVGELSLPVASP